MTGASGEPAGMPPLIEDGEGPPVLLVHGQLGRAEDWLAVMALLRDRHRVLAPDRPGSGANGDGPSGMAANADVLADLLREQGGAPATVVGHSWGGGVAILLAAGHPELVSGLVLAGSVGSGSSVGRFDRVLATPVVGATLVSVALFFAGRAVPWCRARLRRLPPPLGPRLAAVLPDRPFATGRRMRRRVRRTFLVEQRALLDELGDVASALPGISTPTIVVSGQWDGVVAPQAERDLAEAIPGARLVTLPCVAHFLPRDAPGALASLAHEAWEAGHAPG